MDSKALLVSHFEGQVKQNISALMSHVQVKLRCSEWTNVDILHYILIALSQLSRSKTEFNIKHNPYYTMSHYDCSKDLTVMT